MCVWSCYERPQGTEVEHYPHLSSLGADKTLIPRDQRHEHCK